MAPSDVEPYCVVDRDGKFEVRAPSGRTIMVCTDRASASHYAELLKQAFDVGCKKGLREGRSGD
jgi:hypothetical protein